MLVALVLAHHLVANVAFAPVVTVAVTAAAAAAISSAVRTLVTSSDPDPALHSSWR